MVFAVQVLGLLGSVAGKRVLELGAGIGRFTGELCVAGATSVLAVDFMEASIAENRRLHGALYADVLRLAVEDVTCLQLPPASYDVVFTNWLLMYLSDEEVEDLAQRMLTWVRVVSRESSTWVT
jgi:phosphoethanolamine N-methyltransferase